jgi:hypothetical protein
VIEKLLENWLDSASERSYQAVFVQMLAAARYTVLHSTRHCLLEYGKDILAIAPDGTGCAFQLKGDPRGQMKVGEFRREIQYQLLQLTTQTPSYPGFPVGVHRSFLVSNGQFSEEVQIAVTQMNSGPFPSKIELWSRGKLWDLCVTHGASLWPSELQDNRALLEIYLTSPQSQLPRETLASVLESVLHLRETDSILRDSELGRAANSATWLTGISIAPFAEADNHQAVSHAWTLCCAALVAAKSRHGGGESKLLDMALSLAEKTLQDALTGLWEEVRNRDNLVVGNPITDSLIHGWRVTALYGLLSVLAIADSTHRLLEPESSSALKDWLTSARHKPLLWGEGAFAPLATWLVFLRQADATVRVDREIETLARSIVALNQAGSAVALAAPYYGFEEVFRQHEQDSLVHKSGPLETETRGGNSSVATPALHLLVRTNLKAACRSVWPDFSRLTHRRFKMDAAWHFGLLRALGGLEESRIYPPTYGWDQLKQDALTGHEDYKIPDHFAANPWLLAAWWQVAPHRLDADSLRVFVDASLPGWGR